MNDFETPQGESSPSETTRELRSKGPQGRTSESPASLKSELTQWAEYWATAKAHNDGNRGWKSAAEEVLSMIRKARPTHETRAVQEPVGVPVAPDMYRAASHLLSHWDAHRKCFELCGTAVAELQEALAASAAPGHPEPPPEKASEGQS